MTKMKMSGFQWYLKWRLVAHTSRPLTQELMVSSTRRVQEEDVHVSSEGKIRSIRRMRPAEKAKGKETDVKGNMTAKDKNSEEKEPRGR